MGLQHSRLSASRVDLSLQIQLSLVLHGVTHLEFKPLFLLLAHESTWIWLIAALSTMVFQVLKLNE